MAVLIRRVLHNALFLFNPTLRKALNKADIVYAATAQTQKLLKKHYDKDSIYFPENGLTRLKRITPIELSSSTKIKLIWIGRVDSNKALIILLDALKKVKRSNWELHIVGDGPKSTSLKKHPISHLEQVVWHGKIARSKVQEIISEAHLHIVSSLGEGNPTTIWECMEFLVPTLTLDHCGMSGVICDKCGIKIPIESYDKTTTTIAEKIDSIIDNPSIINNLSAGVLHCSEQFSWKNRIEIFNNGYNSINSPQ